MRKTHNIAYTCNSWFQIQCVTYVTITLTPTQISFGPTTMENANDLHMSPQLYIFCFKIHQNSSSHLMVWFPACNYMKSQKYNRHSQYIKLIGYPDICLHSC